MEKNISYRIPEGFNPHTCMNTIRGLADSIHQHMIEAPPNRKRGFEKSMLKRKTRP